MVILRQYSSSLWIPSVSQSTKFSGFASVTLPTKHLILLPVILDHYSALFLILDPDHLKRTCQHLSRSSGFKLTWNGRKLPHMAEFLTTTLAFQIRNTILVRKYFRLLSHLYQVEKLVKMKCHPYFYMNYNLLIIFLAKFARVLILRKVALALTG